MIPDAVDTVALHEGAYAARFGPFSVAGTLELRTLDEVPGGGAIVRITSGSEVTGPLLRSRIRRLRYKLVGMFSPELERGSALLAAEVGIDDGPFVHPERYRRGNVLGKWKRPLVSGTLAASVQFYSGRWFDSGYLPEREIRSGRLTPFSAADPTQGGITQRASATLAYEVTDARRRTWHLGAYVVDTDHRLYSNPTLFLRDRSDGDAIEYVDGRVYYGIDAFYRARHRLGSLRGTVRVGMQARADHATDTTWRTTRRLRLVECHERTNPCTDLVLQTRSVAAYLEDTLRYGKHLQLLAGVRLDQESWNVEDQDADTMLGATSLGGTGARARISPKGGVILSVAGGELFALAGAGAHSSDARAAVDTSGYGAFTRIYNAELGVRLRPDPRVAAAFTSWWSHVAETQVWVPADAAAFRADDARRAGLDARFAFAPVRWLSLDAALTISRGVATPEPARDPDAPTAALLPLAPRLVATAGIALHSRRSLASLRIRGLGPRATSDPAFQAHGHALVDIVASRRWRSFELGLTIENLFAARWRELQRASAVRTSRSVAAHRDLLVTTGIPLTIFGTLAYTP